MQRCPPVAVLELSVGAVVEQELHSLHVVLQRHDVEAAPAVRVHVLPAGTAAHVAVPAAVLVEAQRVLLLPPSVESGADGDVVRPLEARGLEADIDLNGFTIKKACLWVKTGDS